MFEKKDFQLVFEHLRKILKPYAMELNLKTDTSDTYHIDGPYSEKWRKDLFFASVQIKKNYVSFYLMPVYMYPDLLDHITPELRKHMQGKSCFNFKKVELNLFKEFGLLVKESFERFQREGMNQ